MERTHSFGYWLRRRRKALDLTQAELAQRASCSLELIQKIETDARRPSRQMAEKLADVLGIGASERAEFIQAARAERTVDQLELATQPAEQPQRSPQSNLPAQLTSLIGREQEVASITSLLRRPDVRLVTLTGPGGIGKTRLSLQVAAEVMGDFAHGVYFVDLAPIREPSLATSQIAMTLGVKEVGAQPLLATLKAYLRDKQILLLLDNFEQVIDAAPQIAELLASAAQLNVLVTSREVLKLRGEKEIAVLPLALPDPTRLPSLDQLSHYASVALLIERVLDARPDFAVTNANAPAVAEICARLDGLPLAIELAAARLKLFSPEALLVRLSSRLALLSGGPRDLPARQQTVRSTIAWSYHLLNEVEQTLFRRMGVFVGGCTLAAIEAVCMAGERPVDVVEGVTALVDKSLLRQVDGSEGDTRFLMLETIREYALEQLEASGEADALRRRHATYFRDTTQNYTSRRDYLHGNNLERDNLRAALAWSQSAAGDPAFGLDLALHVARIESLRRDSQEACRLLAQALKYAEGLIDTHGYAQATQQLGQFIIILGDFAAGRSLLEQSYTLYQKLGDKLKETEALVNLGWAAREQGDADTARVLLEQGVALSRELDDKNLLINALLTLAEVAVLAEDAARAETLLDECLALSRESKDLQHIGWTLNHLGHAAQLRGDYDRAAQLHNENLALFVDLLGENNGSVVQPYQSLGETALGQSDPVAARGWLAAALRQCDEIGDRVTLAWCLAGLGSAAALSEEPERAARLWGAAERQRQSIGCRPAPAARATYERAMASARAQLTEATFAAAWADGQALTLEQAIAEALRGGD